MPGTLVVFEKILAMFLVIMAGWLVRRRGLADASLTSLLSRFTTDIALPALIFSQMLTKVDQRALMASWAVPLAAAGVLGLGQLVAWLTWRFFCTSPQAPTFIFVVSIANWIYLPLPIVQALYGDHGIRILLLCNVGVQVYLWTVGVATLHGGRLDRSAMKTLLRNPGLIATVAGIVLALTPPHSLGGAVGAIAGGSILEALAMIGSLTIPLSLIVTGFQLGVIPLRGTIDRPMIGVLILRLLATPLLALLIVLLLWHSHVATDRAALAVLYLISAMPVAVSCSILAQRFNQDASLAAQSIFYTTLASLATVPAAYWIFGMVIR